MSHRVSVLLPTYNRADLLGETIDSLLTQTQPVDELLIIDDGSTDGTHQLVSSYGKKIKYLTKTNGGKSSALNFGLQHATGDLIWVCDDDDLLLPHACERLSQTLKTNPKLGYCAGLHEDFVVDTKTGAIEIKPPGYQRQSQPDEIFPDLLDGCHIFQPGLMVHREIYDKVGPFNEQLTRSQDYEMLLRIARASQGILLNEVVFQHREHQGDRGSATERFSIAQANARWIHFHRIIMEPLIPDLSDQELLPDSIWNAPNRTETRQRTAAIKRASVYARNQLWPEAAQLWNSIATEFTQPLDDYEQALIKGATLYSLGCNALLDDPNVRKSIIELRTRSQLGRTILNLLAESLRWRLKSAILSGQLGKAATISRFLIAAF